MIYKSFKDLPQQLADKYRKMIITTRPMYYESNPSFSEEELDNIVSDFIRLHNISWHGLPDQILKVIAGEFEEYSQPEVFPEDKVGEYLFSWNEIPGNDTVRLIEFLEQKFGIDWVKAAKIERIDDGKTIRVSTGKNSLSLRLNDEKTKVNLTIDDGRTDEFIAKTESGKLNIYVGELILYGYDEGVFNGKGEKIMSWEEFQKKYAGQQLMVNLRSDTKKKLILKGIIKGDHNSVYLDDLLLTIRDILRARGYELNKVSKEDIINELSKKWNKDSKEVSEIIRNIALLQNLTDC